MAAPSVARPETLDPIGVIPMNPITQRLTIHARSPRRVGARTPLQNQCPGKKPPSSRNLAAIARRSDAECSVRVISIVRPILPSPMRTIPGNRIDGRVVRDEREGRLFGRLVLRWFCQ
jgi:hypothetical protein